MLLFTRLSEHVEASSSVRVQPLVAMVSISIDVNKRLLVKQLRETVSDIALKEKDDWSSLVGRHVSCGKTVQFFPHLDPHISISSFRIDAHNFCCT